MRVAGTQRRRLLKAALGLPAAALGGCVVTPYGPYYRPSTAQPGARYKGAWCTPLFAGPVDGTGYALLPAEIPLADAPSAVEVALPDLLLGGERLLIAPIRFERRTFDGGVEPFNC